MRRYAIAVLIIGMLFGTVLGGVFLRSAEANTIADFFRNIRNALGGNAPAVTEKAEVSLYKPAYDYENAVVEAVKLASPAVVSITVSKNVPIIERCPGGNPFSDLPSEFQQFFGDQFPGLYVPCERGTSLREVGGGSGFVVSEDGLILTNKHVVTDPKASYTVFTNDGKKYEAKVLALDPLQDLALIKIEVKGMPTVTMGDSDGIALGQTAIAIGNALGEFRNTVSVGVVSGLARTVTALGDAGEPQTIQGVIQTDAAINPGNSGGPLLNLRGEVIAINTAIVSGAQNIGFAIPINMAKRDIESVLRSGRIQAPYLGVRYALNSPERAKTEHLPVDYGAIVRGSGSEPAVAPGSPAARAGIKADDIILEASGTRVDADNPLGSIISRFNVGDKMKFKVRRGDEELVIEATLAERSQDQ